MERYVRLEEISDGRLYGPNDMVRADCGGCEGCPASCCRGMYRRRSIRRRDVLFIRAVRSRASAAGRKFLRSPRRTERPGSAAASTLPKRIYRFFIGKSLKIYCKMLDR